MVMNNIFLCIADKFNKFQKKPEVIDEVDAHNRPVQKVRSAVASPVGLAFSLVVMNQMM